MTDDSKEKRHWAVWIIVVIVAGVVLTGGAIVWRNWGQAKPLLVFPVNNNVELRLEGVLTERNNVFDSRTLGMRIIPKLPERLRFIASRFVTNEGELYKSHLDKGEIGLVLSIVVRDGSAREGTASNSLGESEDRGFYLQVQDNSGGYSQPRRIYQITGGLYTIGDCQVPANLKDLRIQLVENSHEPTARVIHSAVFPNPIYDGDTAE